MYYENLGIFGINKEYFCYKIKIESLLRIIFWTFRIIFLLFLNIFKKYIYGIVWGNWTSQFLRHDRDKV